MGIEIDLMKLYPKGKSRTGLRPNITEEDRQVSKKFDFDYFDGDRRHGYGGFSYHPRFWTETVLLFRDYYHLNPDAAILDVGCAKGFMLADFRKLMPEAHIAGVDVSSYAIAHGHPDVVNCIQVANAKKLPYADCSFDLVISVNTIHNLRRHECIQALQEIQRVTRNHAFVMVDGWHNDEQKKTMYEWVLTAETMMHADEWRELFSAAGYTGDYFFWTVS